MELLSLVMFSAPVPVQLEFTPQPLNWYCLARETGIVLNCDRQNGPFPQSAQRHHEPVWAVYCVAAGGQYRAVLRNVDHATAFAHAVDLRRKLSCTICVAPEDETIALEQLLASEDESSVSEL